MKQILKSVTALTLALLMLLSLAPAALAEENPEREAVLARAAELEKDAGKLRSVAVHVYSGEDPVLPGEKDNRDSAFLKHLSIALESRWALEAEEAPDTPAAELRTLYRQYAEAELAVLAEYREGGMDDPLMGFLSQEYLAWLDSQIEASEGDEGDDLAFLWRWNDARQQNIRVLFFLNRYYGVPVHRVWKDQMNSRLYEGALLISEDTIQKLLDARLQPAETAETAETAAEAPADTAYGPDAWHSAPGGKYEFRLYGFDSENLTMKVELREIESRKDIPCGNINLSVWSKYQKNRQVVDTFYKVRDVAEEDGKLTFNLYMNVMLDGRLYQEAKGRLTLKLPGARQESASGAAADAGEEEENIPEEIIEQDFTELKVGDEIRMGYYEQDGNAENLREPIEWRVISVNKKKNVALVVTVHGIDAMAYGTPGDTESYTQVGFSWKTSALREWMNGDFYDTAFTRKEKARIRQVENITKCASGRIRTKDYIFLLSSEEARRYMKTTEGMICTPTAYAAAKLAEGAEYITKEGYCAWWLRELATAAKNDRSGKYKAGTVNAGGYVLGSTGMRYFSRKIGFPIYQEDAATIRPAMWIKFGE